METVHVGTRTGYDVLIGDGILSSAGNTARALLGDAHEAVVVSDDNIAPLYADKLIKVLENSGFNAALFTFAHGESSKCFTTLEKLLGFLADRRFPRNGVIFALGGGVTGDLAGFAASVYERGVRYIQIPTTLLAAVDSSVGGKTAIDFNGVKNLVGAFYQPSLVVCDTSLLATLPAREIKCGLAEAVKYGFIAHPKLIKLTSETQRDYAKIICLCVKIKSKIVTEDEFDHSARRILNFGHTIGHALEALADGKLLHGEAVATGMYIETRLAVSANILSERDGAKIQSILTGMFGDELLKTEFSPDEIISSALSDKKNTDAEIGFALPQRIGACDFYTFTETSLKNHLNRIL